MKIKIGTRGSALALWQAQWVAGRLKQEGLDPEVIPITTKGDQILEVSISKIGSKGVFTQELEDHLAAGVVDLAVHSAKDLPSELPDIFEIIAFGERAYPGDVLVAAQEIDLEGGKRITIGTSSTRRVALIKHYYPEITLVDMRGNVPTRIKKMQRGDCQALMLAHAGVHRLGFDHLIRKKLPTDQFVPAVGQGSVAIEVARSLDPELKARVRQALNHQETEDCLRAERSFLRVLQGGCSIPAFALAQYQQTRITIHGGIIGLDGVKMIEERFEDQAENAELLGAKLGQTILDRGGVALLKEIRKAL